jgi:chemotaxis response regulator CheB
MATSPQKKFRVLVVDDSAFMCKVLETIFNADEHLQVVGKARDGREAIALAETLKPDVITMDLNMPHLDGLQATAHIMTSNPRPIVVVSSETREGAASTLKALELGAIEFVTKPSGGLIWTCRASRKTCCGKYAWLQRFAWCARHRAWSVGCSRWPQSRCQQTRRLGQQLLLPTFRAICAFLLWCSPRPRADQQR